MFAVKGWKISADSLKTETHTQSPPGPSDNANTGQGSTLERENPDRPTKKRKRQGRADKHVTTENFADLWREHIDGVKPKKVQRDKNQKEANAGSTEPTAKSSNAQAFKSTSSVNQKKKQKEKKVKKYNQVDEAQAQNQSDKDSTQAITSNTVSEAAKDTKLVVPDPAGKLTPLQTSMRQKLISSRFRYLNETLYTKPSTSSLDLFTQNPNFFSEYHEGFRRQVTAWPENPVDGFMKWIYERGIIRDKRDLGSQKAKYRRDKKGKKGKLPPQEQDTATVSEKNDIDPLPRDFRTGICTIVDLGCGDAQLAEALSKSPPNPPAMKTLRLKINSYDLAATSPLVTVADISSVPLPDNSVDVAIFSLALMGTNWIDFIEEAYRILRWKGECWISEVCSRFAGKSHQRVAHSVGNRNKSQDSRKLQGRNKPRQTNDVPEENFETIESVNSTDQATTDVSAFVTVLQRRGFIMQNTPELGNKMFVRMRFAKTAPAIVGKCAKGLSVPGSTGKRFLDQDGADQISVEDEARVLKPCLYKTR